MNKTIQFKGINRNNSITNNADGNCEEVMNLRPKQGRWEAVMRKKKAYKNDWLDKLEYPAHIVKYHQHKVGDKINNIYIIHEEGDGKKSDFRIKGVWVKEVGVDYEIVLLWQIETGVKYADVDSSLGIDIESIGNFLSFNLPEVTTFLWKEGVYTKTKQDETIPPTISTFIQSRFSSFSPLIGVERVAGFGAQIGGWSHIASPVYSQDPDIYPLNRPRGVVFNTASPNIPVSAICQQNTHDDNLPLQFCNIKFDTSVNTEFQNKLGGAYHTMQTETEDYREGFVFFCSAYELFDGSITNVSAPQLIHLGTTGFKGAPFNDEVYDTFHNRDKYQIIGYKMNGYPHLIDSFGFGITGILRRQRQQRLIFERPNDIPDNLGEEYVKVVYFVSKPISMYDFSKVDVHKLHLNIMLAIEGDSVTGSTFPYYIQNEHASQNSTLVRLSLSNKMSVIPDSSGAIGAKYTNEELDEALPMHLPTKEELENLTLYRAVDFDINDDNDRGTRYTDEKSTYVGKAVNFNTLETSEPLEASTSSNETYMAGGLMAYNRRLHMYNVKTLYRNDLATYNKSIYSVEDYSDIFNGTIDELLLNGKKTNLFYARNGFLPSSDVNTKDNYKSAVYAQYTLLNAQGEYMVYTDRIGNGKSPIIPFQDSRLKYVDIYCDLYLGKYAKIRLNAFESKTMNLSFIDFWKFERVGNENFLAEYNVQFVSEDTINKVREKIGTWDFNEENNSNRLKVSNPSNPMIFPPELDFDFDDEIVALGNNYKEISLAQEGQYPTYVFTKKGIWSMGLGTEAFYATQIPVNPDVAVCRHTLGIGNGIVYVAKDGIKVLSGRDVISISEPLRGHISHIDDLISVRSALGLGQSPNRLNTIYQDIYDGLRIVEASVEQDLFGPNTVLGYDRVNNEVIVCDTNYMHDDTSYIFSLNEKMWYRRSEKFYSFHRDYGCKRYDYIINIEQNGEQIYPIDNAVVWLCEEYNGGVPRPQASPITVDTQVFILTRPMSIGNLGFKEIYHTALRGELRQNGNKLGTIGKLPVDPNYPHLGFYILSSNDGGTWKMVGGKVWKESVTQVVLERIKQSYRYFALMFAGYVSADFNITHVDLDGIDKYNTKQR